MKCFFRAGAFRILCAAGLATAFLPAGGSAADLRWEALPDRERITIIMAPNEGMPGKVARITPTGVLVPFTEVPEGLLVTKKPEGAVIFQGTKPLGRALALLTTSPEFGFIVTAHSSTRLVVEFFPDKLGARWRPTEKAPTTEIPPDFAVPVYAPATPTGQTPAAPAASPVKPATQAAPTPQTQPAQSAPQPVAPPAQAPAPAPQAAQPATPQARPAEPAPQTAGQNAPQSGPTSVPHFRQEPHRSAVPVVITPDGTPLTGPAARPALVPSGQNGPETTPPAQTAPQAQPPRSGRPQSALPNATPEAVPALQNPNGTPMLDIRPETAGRAADLPDPRPATPMESPSAATAANTGPDAKQPAVEPGVSVVRRPATRQAAAPVSRQSALPGSQTATPPPAQATPAQVPPTQTTPVQGASKLVAAQTAPEAPARQPAAPVLIPGVGVPAPGANLSKGRVHLGSLESIDAPPDDTAVTVPLLYPDTDKSKTSPASTAEATPPVAPEKIYVDDKGNPVEPPADPAQMLPEIRADIVAGGFAVALEKAEKLLAQTNLETSQREELLHIRADMTFALHKDKLQEHYQDIVDTARQAVSFNQDSPRNAGALLRLGYVNLKVNNIPEAGSEFNRLRRQYPNDENVPLTYYYWGDYHYGKNEFQDAADQFQYILQTYPDSRYAREAALGLARSYYRLGYYDQSFNVVGYIEKRWPRFYLEYPPFLNMVGDTAFRLNKLDEALKQYRLYINLEPSGQETDVILTRIGDIYALEKENGAANEMYQTAVQRFPDKDGGLVAKMRLAERGINDDPSMSGMFSVFDNRFKAAPPEVYREIISQHPDSALVPLAELKLAMWHLWNKQYMETLQACSDFLDKYPKHELAPKVQETALKTFAALAAQSRDQGSYALMHEAWERYPIVRNKDEMLSPESRLALAVSYWNNKQPQEALGVIEPFFLGDKVQGISESALQLVLTIYLDYEHWNAIREVGRRVELWELTPEVQQQLDYALALASENLGEPEKAAPTWQKLYDSGTLSPSRMATAAFFLARDAERAGNLEQSYVYGTEALNRLQEEARKTPTQADTGKIKSQLGSLMDIAEAAGRLHEALEYAQKYLEYLPENDAERVGVLYRAARIHRKQGDLDAWKKGLTELVAKYPDTLYGRTAASELQGAEIIDGAAGFSPTGSI